MERKIGHTISDILETIERVQLRGAPLVSIREFEFVLAKTEVFSSSLSLASPKGCSPRRLIVKNNENLQRLGKFLV